VTPDELRGAIEKAGPTDLAAALARDVRATASALPAEAVRLAGAGPAIAPRARMLVSQLEELAAGPLLGAPASPDPSTEVWMIGAATAAAVNLRGRVAQRLQPMLADRRLLAGPPPDPRVEEPVRPRRVCDEAYALLRELVNVAEGRSALVMDRWAFERLPESERDAEIARVQGGAAFARLLDDGQA
jgi:hypothetical protein